MDFIFLIASFVGGELPLLGADDWRTREAATDRLDNPLCALFLPKCDENPEIDARVKRLRQKQLCWLNPVYVERHTRATDYERWLMLYVLGDRESIYHDYEVFYELHTDRDRAGMFFKLAPFCDGEPGGYQGIPGWLRDWFIDGEYERFLEHRDGYRHLYRNR